VQTLGTVGTQDPALTQAFMDWAVQSNDAGVREAALKALPKMDGGNRALGTFILTLSKATGNLPRLHAIEAIGTLGKGNEDAMAALQSVIEFEGDNDILVPAARKALAKIQVK